MDGQVFTVGKLHYVNGVVYFSAQKEKTDLATLAEHHAETTKSGNVKHPKTRVSTLVRMAEGLGLVTLSNRQQVQITGLGQEYFRNRAKDRWSLSGSQQDLLRNHILASPECSPTIYAITSLLALIKQGLRDKELAHQYALSIGKEKAWNSEVTYDGFTKFGISYLVELGFIDADLSIQSYRVRSPVRQAEVPRVLIPKLQPAKRRREYNLYSDELRSQVVRGWLFSRQTHRQLDEIVLGLDGDSSRGYQSMGILHFLGLKAEFHGLFENMPENHAVELLKADPQDFGVVISFLEHDICTMSMNDLIRAEAKDIAASRRDTGEARRKRISHAEQHPPRLRVYSYTYQRNPDIVAEALERSNGVCEACQKPAPFNRLSDGTPFLEVHHVKSLSDGGTDTLDNVLSLCPNCRRERHYG